MKRNGRRVSQQMCALLSALRGVLTITGVMVSLSLFSPLLQEHNASHNMVWTESVYRLKIINNKLYPYLLWHFFFSHRKPYFHLYFAFTLSMFIFLREGITQTRVKLIEFIPIHVLLYECNLDHFHLDQFMINILGKHKR